MTVNAPPRSSPARAMCFSESSERSPVAINELICEVVTTSLGELKSRRVSLALQLFDDLSPVQATECNSASTCQFVTNAIDSMASIADRPQTLVVRSERLDEWVLISVQDSAMRLMPNLTAAPDR